MKFLKEYSDFFFFKKNKKCKITQHARLKYMGQLMRVCILLKAPRKNASEKLRLLKSSAANNCLTLLTNLSIEANTVDPDQTAPIGGSRSDCSTLFVIEAS